MSQGFHEAQDPRTGKAPKHSEAAVKHKDISNTEIAPSFNLKKKAKRPTGYWTEENIIKDLELIIEDLGDFPTTVYLRKIKRSDLAYAISKHSNVNHFKEKMGYKITKRASGSWTEESIIKELEPIINELGKFPTHAQLIEMKRSELSYAIVNNRGYNYFKEKMEHEITKRSPGYWTEEIITKELELIIEKLGHFPIQKELAEMKRRDLVHAITRHSNINYFREKFGYEPIQKSTGYWNEKTIIADLEPIIEELGHFPVQRELKEIGRRDLEGAINTCGGYHHFRKKMGYEPIKKPHGYWTEENIIKELKQIIEESHDFPTQFKLRETGNIDLSTAIDKHGGMNYYREKLGFPPSETDPLKMSYIGKRGKKSEDCVEYLLNVWTEEHGEAPPELNVKLGHGRLEFVFDYFGQRVGIDVTNTKGRKGNAYTTIRNKWRHREYHLNLDELWIVVFTDILSSEDYDKLNEKGPENVKVFSIDGFLMELDYSTKYYDMNKIGKLQNCSFHNKEEMKGINTTVNEEQHLEVLK